MSWARRHYGPEFAAWLAAEFEPVDPVFRLAEQHGVVLLNGGGFGDTAWSVRVSLANLPGGRLPPRRREPPRCSRAVRGRLVEDIGKLTRRYADIASGRSGRERPRTDEGGHVERHRACSEPAGYVRADSHAAAAGQRGRAREGRRDGADRSGRHARARRQGQRVRRLDPRARRPLARLRGQGRRRALDGRRRHPGRGRHVEPSARSRRCAR